MKIINLLPKEKQQELKHEAVFGSLLSVFWISCASFLLVFAAQFGARLYLDHQVSALEGHIKQLQEQVARQDNATIKTRVTSVNGVITDFNNLSESAPQWSNLLRAFAPLPPAGVHINSLQVEPTSKVVTIAGHSPTRELVIELYNNILKDTQHFSGIDYYWENILRPTDDNFHFTFSYHDSILH